MSRHGDTTGGGEMPEILHQIRRAARWVFRGFESERSDEPPYDASWTLTFQITVEHDDLDDVWIAECIDLPGCLSYGDSEAEALDNLQDAIEGVLVARIGERLEADEKRRHEATAPAPERVRERKLEVKIALGA
jgi:predicted RNase H-like HicB family nuclease